MKLSLKDVLVATLLAACLIIAPSAYVPAFASAFPPPSSNEITTLSSEPVLSLSTTGVVGTETPRGKPNPETQALIDKISEIVKKEDLLNVSYVEGVFNTKFPEPSYLTYAPQTDHPNTLCGIVGCIYIDRKAMQTSNIYGLFYRIWVRPQEGTPSQPYEHPIRASFEVASINPKRFCLKRSDFQSLFDSPPQGIPVDHADGREFTKQSGSKTIGLATTQPVGKECLMDITVWINYAPTAN